ncbi:MAG: glycosyltransferase family 4 protein [Armatimonadota bacterium]|nr:glycosyltransferase family 4 protein [Armatimonadota bacterium]
MSDCTGKPKGRVLILVENLPVPMDRRVWLESLALTEAGYQVSVISPRAPEEPEYIELEGVHLYRYPMPPPTRSTLSFIYEFIYCWLHTWRLTRRVWKERGFDVIHTCNPPDTFWLIGRIYKRKGVKVVFDQHDLCPELYESRFGKRGLLYKGLLWLEKQTYRTADGVIATNESYRRVAMERGGVPPERIVVVRSGPCASRFHRVEPDPSLKRGRKYLGVYLGVMGAQDGVDYLLRAIDHVVHTFNFHDCHFALIGSGDMFPDLVKLSQRLNITEFVEFTGRIPDADLLRYFSTADIALAPDPLNPLNDVSTMNKIIEYMAVGLPIVSFDLKESRFSAQEAAVYIPNNDEKAFAKAIIDLLNNPEQRARMSEFGRKRFLECLSWEHSKQKLIEFYDNLMQTPCRQGK